MQKCFWSAFLMTASRWILFFLFFFRQTQIAWGLCKKTTILLTWSLVSLVLCYNPNNVHLVSYYQKEDKIIGVLIFFYFVAYCIFLYIAWQHPTQTNKWFCSMMLHSCLTIAEWLTTKSFIFLWHCTFISATEDVCLFVDRQDQLPPNLHHPMFLRFLLTKSDLKILIFFFLKQFLSNSFSLFVSYPYWIMCFQFSVKMYT